MRARFADTLVGFGVKATWPLVAYIRANLSHDHNEGVIEAIRVLGVIGDREVGPSLAGILRVATDPEVRIAAIESLGMVGGPLAIRPLKYTFRFPDWRLRAKSATSLGHIGDPSINPVLVTGLQDSNWWVRRNSASALAALPGGDELLLLAIGSDDPVRQGCRCRSPGRLWRPGRCPRTARGRTGDRQRPCCSSITSEPASRCSRDPRDPALGGVRHDHLLHLHAGLHDRARDAVGGGHAPGPSSRSIRPRLRDALQPDFAPGLDSDPRLQRGGGNSRLGQLDVDRRLPALRDRGRQRRFHRRDARGPDRSLPSRARPNPLSAGHRHCSGQGHLPGPRLLRHHGHRQGERREGRCPERRDQRRPISVCPVHRRRCDPRCQLPDRGDATGRGGSPDERSGSGATFGH